MGRDPADLRQRAPEGPAKGHREVGRHLVRFGPRFRADLRGQIAYLIDREEPSWVARLLQDLADLQDLLTDFPEAGRELRREDETSLRKLKLRRSPFVVWYVVEPDAPDWDVTMLRLFHSRQRTPRPRLP